MRLVEKIKSIYIRNIQIMHTSFIVERRYTFIAPTYLSKLLYARQFELLFIGWKEMKHLNCISVDYISRYIFKV